MLTPEQRQRLVANLTTWRRNRLRIEGKREPHSIDAATTKQLLHDSVIFGFNAVTITWQHRELTANEREWELFPRPGKMWVPTVTRQDPRDVVLASTISLDSDDDVL